MFARRLVWEKSSSTFSFVAFTSPAAPHAGQSAPSSWPSARWSHRQAPCAPLQEPRLDTSQKDLHRVRFIPDTRLLRTPGQCLGKTLLRLAHICRDDALNVRHDVLHNVVEPKQTAGFESFRLDCFPLTTNIFKVIFEILYFSIVLQNERPETKRGMERDWNKRKF